MNSDKIKSTRYKDENGHIIVTYDIKSFAKELRKRLIKDKIIALFFYLLMLTIFSGLITLLYAVAVGIV